MKHLPRAIFLDLDGTILTSGCRQTALLRVTEEFSTIIAPLDVGTLANRLDAAFEGFWSDVEQDKHARLGVQAARQEVVSKVFADVGAPNLTRQLAELFAARFASYREETMDFFPGALATIQTLHRRGVRLGLITNGASNTQRAKIERFSLAPLFDHIQIEGEYGFGKPETRAYLHAMKALGVRAHEVWMVGDHLDWEVAAPQKIGIYAVWHDWSGGGLPLGSTVWPDKIVRSLEDLLN